MSKNEKVIQKLKGVANILAIMSETNPGTILWSENGHLLLFDELRDCIDLLENPNDMF